MDCTEKMIGTALAAQVLRITPRRVVGLCAEGRFKGAVHSGKSWKIPESEVMNLARQNGIEETSYESERSLRPCAPGNTSFPDLASNCYLVDKTLMIQELFSNAGKTKVFLMPPQFGKTVMISMLQAFLEIGREDASYWFEGLNILRNGKLTASLMGKFPVIRISFKDICCPTWDESLETLRIILQNEFRRHLELAESPRLHPGEKEYLQRMECGILSEVELCRALMNLTAMLSEHYGNETVLLIEDYDVPAESAEKEGFGKEMHRFLRSMLRCGIKDNHSLKTAVITGTFLKSDLLEDLSASVYDGRDGRYAGCFGVTEPEVQKLTQYYGKESRLDEIRSWFGGYRFGNTEVFNPGAVFGYFANGYAPERALLNIGNAEGIKGDLENMPEEMSERISELLQGNTVRLIMSNSEGIEDDRKNPDSIFLYLLHSGLLAWTEPPDETEHGILACLRIPNKTARRSICGQVRGWAAKYGTGAEISDLWMSVFQEDPERFTEAFIRVCISFISHSGGKNLYSSLLLCLSATLGEEYRILSERTEKDRFFLKLYPRKQTLKEVWAGYREVPGSRKYMMSDLAEEMAEQEEDWEGVRIGVAYCGIDAEVYY